MTRKSKQSLVDDAIGLLIEHFGIEKVRAAFEKSTSETPVPSKPQRESHSTRAEHPANPTVSSLLEHLRLQDEEKYLILSDFYVNLKDRKVLTESQDIRHFAQTIGLKEIRGTSRRSMIPKLIQFLAGQQAELLRTHIRNAENVSEPQRQRGFSAITDKLLGEKPRKGA